jgi:uncharacterized protein (DUF433 family)
MGSVIDIGALIAHSADIRGGRARIAGTGVTVRRVVSLYQLGLSPEDITDQIRHLTLAQVFAALAYYHANRDEIEADLATERAQAEALLEDHLRSRESAG